MVDINGRAGIMSGLVNQGIKRYFKDNPIEDNAEILGKIYDRLEEIEVFIKHLSQKPSGETVIELDTK